MNSRLSSMLMQLTTHGQCTHIQQQINIKFLATAHKRHKKLLSIHYNWARWQATIQMTPSFVSLNPQLTEQQGRAFVK
uniref:Uncharacterized protein n=1 Tax=Anguilla anguilla TaxID=7936 RepID=A0A0E9VYQ2_ANGAN